MHQELVLRARMKLLSTDRRVLRGPDALWVYRVLTQVNPAAHGSKLAHVLVEASRSHRLHQLPDARLALLEEAVAVARALDAANPFRAKVLAKALEARQRELSAS
ncbi:hypothetical protein [Kitasatospora sp. NBC_01266]|uniref:hypothetical protein n=1 Tax=Kitasatospora sp. NBC_01266 TaxID=2903572 RepID=UPI002E37D700|nr:hypothetical protein [Kitasatospora sp. NBC_01266]